MSEKFYYIKGSMANPEEEWLDYIDELRNSKIRL